MSSDDERPGEGGLVERIARSPLAVGVLFALFIAAGIALYLAVVISMARY